MTGINTAFVCTKCDRLLFSDSLIGASDGVEVNLQNFGGGPCPYCGGYVKGIDGVYSMRDGATLFDDFYNVLDSLRLTRGELQELQRILRDAQAENLPEAEVSKRIRQIVPAAAQLGDLITSSRAAALYTLISVLVTMWMAFGLTPAQERQVIIYQFIEQYIEENNCEEYDAFISPVARDQ